MSSVDAESGNWMTGLPRDAEPVFAVGETEPLRADGIRVRPELADSNGNSVAGSDYSASLLRSHFEGIQLDSLLTLLLSLGREWAAVNKNDLIAGGDAEGRPCPLHNTNRLHSLFLRKSRFLRPRFNGQFFQALG